jgi:hypothetical protein
MKFQELNAQKVSTKEQVLFANMPSLPAPMPTNNNRIVSTNDKYDTLHVCTSWADAKAQLGIAKCVIRNPVKAEGKRKFIIGTSDETGKTGWDNCGLVSEEVSENEIAEIMSQLIDHYDELLTVRIVKFHGVDEKTKQPFLPTMLVQLAGNKYTVADDEIMF